MVTYKGASYYFRTIFLFAFLWFANTEQSFTQNVQTLESFAGSVADVTDEGPVSTKTFELLRNTNNPGGNSTTSYLPQTEVTITLDNFNTTYNSQQTDLSDVALPPVVMGWFAKQSDNTRGDFIDAIWYENGIPDPIFQPHNFISDPNSGYFDATPPGPIEGFDIAANHGVVISGLFSGLGRENEPLLDGGGNPIDYELADLTISFTKPITNPVLQITGLGAKWEASITQGSITQNYRNSASIELDLIDAVLNFETGTSAPGNVSLSILSNGGTPLGLEGSTKIVNTSNDPSDFYAGYTPGDATDGAASGSVLVTGENVTELTFRVFVRAGTEGLNNAGADEGFGWAGDNTNGQWIWDDTGFQIFAVSDGSGDPDPNNDETVDLIVDNSQTADDIPLAYYFAEDAFMLSVTSEIEALEVTQGPCWRTISSPVDGQTYENFFASFGTQGNDYGGLWTQGNIPGARTNTGDPNVYTMNSDGTTWVPVSDLTVPIPAGTGMLISVFSDDDYTGPNPGGFPKTVDHTGAENATPTNVALGSPNGTSGSPGGFSMLGNPFYDNIDFDLLSTNEIESNVWVYDRNAGGTGPNGNNGGWISWNGSSGDISEGLIAQGQGFVVQNTGSASSPDVDFVGGSKVANAATFYGKENLKPDHLRLEVSGKSVYNSAWIEFSDESSLNEYNPTNGDVVQFFPFESDYAVLSTLKNGQLLDIGRFPYPGAVGIKIPLSLETTSNETMTLELTDLKYSGQSLYLNDTVTGKTIELTEGATYTFLANGTATKRTNDCFSTPTGFLGPEKAKNNGPRFYIGTEASFNNVNIEDIPTEFGLRQNYPNPFNPTTQITYQLPEQSNVRLEVYDLTGRQVATLVDETIGAGSHTVNFNAVNLSSGVYIYRLNAGNAVLSRKLTVIK